MQNYYRVGVSLEAASLFLRNRGKTVYILPSSDHTFVLLLVGFTEYVDDVQVQILQDAHIGLVSRRSVCR
ncbi:hypothetical protein Hanom_Chr03g00272381 [Helianthus anomalus]